MSSPKTPDDIGMAPPKRRRREPSLNPPPELLNKHGGRVLDPSSAVRLPGQPPIRPTVYVGARLLVRSVKLDEEVLPALNQAATEANLRLVFEEADGRLLELARQAGLEDLALRVLATRVRLEPATDKPAAPPDAWKVLQNYRSIVGPNSPAAHQVSLDHLLTATHSAGISGVPYMGGGSVGGVPYMGGGSVDGVPYMGGGSVGISSQYGIPGHGGRTPVTWLGPVPTRVAQQDLPCRRPVIAVLDTGVGKHPWLPASIVKRHPSVGSLPIGHTDPATDPEVSGQLGSPLEGTLDTDAGHGTFIAGLIRQICPDANILAIRVMYGDGAVPEGDLLEALNRLLLRQALAQALDKPSWLVDVISLSLGYYHELPADFAYDQLLIETLRALGELGVAVIAAAGNDATARHFYPAGFAPHTDRRLNPVERDVLPVISVGALNPDLESIALFSNAGDWVCCHRQGAALVSTMPTTFDGSLQPAAAVHVNGRLRSTIDPDNFHGGFSVWSGTSFAAPILAAEVAKSLWETKELDTSDPAAMLGRGWSALERLVQLRRPEPSALSNGRPPVPAY
ncbi:S8 family peptidase [Jatrophihabitans sp.]|jgi:subtilisin family serine protease|uniref:S8 family peptidase n=1 Tax=Jatrophihabitans sp. TaxID=1932789 RepID=UPI002EEF1B83